MKCHYRRIRSAVGENILLHTIRNFLLFPEWPFTPKRWPNMWPKGTLCPNHKLFVICILLCHTSCLYRTLNFAVSLESCCLLRTVPLPILKKTNFGFGYVFLFGSMYKQNINFNQSIKQCLSTSKKYGSFSQTYWHPELI